MPKKSTEPRIAIVAPNKDIYSETFIYAHKTRLKGEKFFYYGSLDKIMLENSGSLSQHADLVLKLKRKFKGKSYSWYHQELLKRSFIKNKIDVVFAEYGPKAQSLLPIVKSLNLPLIVHFHGFDASVYQIVKANNNYKELFKVAQYVIVVSRKMFRDLLDLGCPKNKLVYNVYGPNEKFYDVNSKFTEPQFISVGRFVDKKAPYYLILAFEKVVVKYPEARLVMAGKGELLNVCKNLVKYYGLNDKIIFPGVISAEEYRKYLNSSVAMIQHSVTADSGDSEGTPVAIIEASASGLPVISTRHAGIPDVILDGETGFLVEEHEVTKMAEYMLMFLQNREMARTMGKKGKQNIQVNYSLNKHIECLDHLIDQTLIQSR